MLSFFSWNMNRFLSKSNSTNMGVGNTQDQAFDRQYERISR